MKNLFNLMLLCAAFGLFFACSEPGYDDSGDNVAFSPEAVDLGLPSGLKWASCNVGATKPEEYGGYYAWGETEEKEEYSWETYKWCNGTDDTITKYCVYSGHGVIDDKSVLELEDDVAHVRWGGNWRMPTKPELIELWDECEWDDATVNGVYGQRVTGPNGNSIFLPAAGYRDNIILKSDGNMGYYWSNMLYGIYSSDIACSMRFYGSRYQDSRHFGYTVRPVCE